LFKDAEWHAWTVRVLAQEIGRGNLLVNPVVYAEASPKFESHSEFQRSLSVLGIALEHLPWEAAFEAGRAHAMYRKSGGVRERTLPDFFIGAHAKVGGLRLVTRDAGRYRSCFPDLEIVAPDTHP
jgi:hypothetical protein